MPRKPIEEITDKQREILELIIEGVQKNGYQPSRAELAMATGTTRHAVTTKINHLVNKGYLEVASQGGERCLRICGVAFTARLLTDEFLQAGVEKTLREIVWHKGD